MLGDVEARVARIRILDEPGDVVGNVTYHGAAERYHSDQHDADAHYRDHVPRRTDVTDDRLDAARVKDHRDRAVQRFEKAHLVLPCEDHNYHRTYEEEHQVEYEYREKHYLPGLLRHLDAEPFIETFSHNTHLRKVRTVPPV